MIRLTRLDGEAFLLNAELIKYVESRPDTFLTLTTGDRVVARETPEEVLRLVIEYQQSKQLLPDSHRAADTNRTPPAAGTIGPTPPTP